MYSLMACGRRKIFWLRAKPPSVTTCVVYVGCRKCDDEHVIVLVIPASLARSYLETLLSSLLTALAGISQVLVIPASLARSYSETLLSSLLTALAGISQVLRLRRQGTADFFTVADPSKLPGSFLPSTPEPTPDPETPPPDSPSTPRASTSPEQEVPSSSSSQSSSSTRDSNSSQVIRDLTPNPDSTSHNMSADPSSSSSSLNTNSLRLCTEKLNNNNFAAWRYDMLNALAYMGLGKFIKEHSPELKARPDYKERLVQVTTYIRLHLGREDSTRFVDDLDVYDPKALWDSILEYHAAKTVENAANIMEKLHDVVFTKGDMQQSINTFRQTFQLMIEVSSSKFDKKTLEAVWVFFALKRLPASFTMFRTLQFASFKSESTTVTMSKFLLELETELRRQQESTAQLAATATALAVRSAASGRTPTSANPPSNLSEKKRRPFCTNGTHNPECTGHSPADCHQLNPAKAAAYHQGLLDKANAALAKKALISVNSGVADAIVLDSGASGHYLKRKEYFTSFIPIKSSVFGANGAAIPILGTGSAIIQGASGPIVISEAFYAPDLSNSLLPLTFYVRLGYTVFPTNDGLGFACRRGDHILCIGTTTEQVMLISLNEPKALSVGNPRPTAIDLHRALGHPSLGYLKKAFPDISIPEVECRVCDLSKMHRQPFSGSFPKASKPLEMIHMDLCGPMTPASRRGNLYFLKIIDGFSKYRFIYPITRKSDTFHTFKTFLTEVEKASGHKLISVVSDNGGEFVNNQFLSLFSDHGIQHLTTAPYTPQQNPFAERGNRTTIEKARAMLATAGMPLQWWGEAVITSVYLENRSPDSSIQFKSPYELWHGAAPDLSHLVPFGCRAVKYLEKSDRASKFSPSGVEAIFLGYDGNHRSYKFSYDSTTLFDFSALQSAPLESSSARIVELPDDVPESRPHTPLTPPSRGEEAHCTTPTDSGSSAPPAVLAEKSPSVPSTSPSIPAPAEPSVKGYALVPHFDKAPQDISSAIDPFNIIEGSRRRRALVMRRHQANLIVGEPASLKDPRTYGDILGRLDESHWLMAVEVELNNIRRHEVWVVAPLTPGVKPLDTTWVFKRKFDADGELLKYKARLCVRGFRQIEGIDYDATFAPTGRLTTLRLILGLAALHDYDIQQMDVKCAFLNGIPDEDLFIKVPDGVGVELPPGHGLKLQKSLYGLKQSPRCWYKSLKDFFVSVNFQPSAVDPCLFVHQDPARFCCVYIHVDDLVIVGPDVAFLKTAITNRFEMDDLGDCKWVLGMRVTRDRPNRTITLSQDRYCKEILDEYGMLDCRSIGAPLPTNATTCPIDPAPISPGFNFRRGVGLLNYLVQCTRPDLAFTCSYLSQYLNNPSKTHQNHFLHVLRYIQHTKSYGLTLGAVSPTPSTLVAYADASYATATQAYSFAGSAILHNGLIGWRCAKMDSDAPATSTTESEYRACSECGQDILWTQQLLDSLRPFLTLPPAEVTLHCDNQGALALLKNSIYQHRTRHINVRYHWLRHHIEQDESFHLSYIPTDQNLADFLTKALTPIKTRQALAYVSLKACESPV
ncbi:hypothetical protein PCASD_12562 [Puccinia coronata f. sp. avenae]|uniref:Integrase catalytic domain-containing protein n=1 Tax=Puccinia coronata f. sp. avenae TaxID=200324 RepID=A0A2N5UM19_9BASI|nr:hypothetical protein PCASD_12562 [Puccinia coronata f. sp. avenae]